MAVRFQYGRGKYGADPGCLGLSGQAGAAVESVDVIDIARHAVEKNRQHAIPLHPSQCFRESVRIICRDPRSGDDRHMQGEIHERGEGRAASVLGVEDADLWISWSHAPDGLITPCAHGDRAVTVEITAIED